MTAAAPAPAAPAASPAPAPAAPAAADPIKPVTPAAPAAPAAAAPAPAADPKGGGTVLDPPADPAAAPAAADKPGAWPDNWREIASTGKDGKVDDKRLARYQRYASPLVALEAMINAQDRIAKGDLQKVLGPTPTEDEVKEYRLANGIPDKPEGYKVELAEGRVVGEADKPLVDKFLANMHKANASPAYVNAALNAYYEMQDEQTAARADGDKQSRTKVEDELRLEYGPEYRGNLNAVSGLLAQFPEGNKLRTARFPDGTLLFNDPAMLRHFVHLARTMNPAATLVPGSSANASQTIVDELNALKADIANPDSDYHTGPKIEKGGQKDTAKAHRYRELLAAQERLEASGRARAA